MDKKIEIKKIVDFFFTPCKLGIVLKFKPFLEIPWIKNKIHKLKLLLLTQKTQHKNLLLLHSQAKINQQRNLTGNTLMLGHYCPSFSSPATPLIPAELHYQKMSKGEIIGQ